MAKRFGTTVNIAVIAATLGLAAVSLTACGSDNASSTEAATATAPSTAASSSASREAYAGTRNVRICVTLNPAFTEAIDMSAIQGSKGKSVTFDASNRGPECYVSDNSSFNGVAGAQALYETSTLIIYGQNLTFQRPDLLLCSRTTAPVVGPVDCASGAQLDLKTFSEGDTKSLNGNGHSVTAKRNTNTDEYIEFAVQINK
jgi:hypothetical protein